MKKRIDSHAIINKANFFKVLRRFLYKSIVVLAIILVLTIIKKINLVSTNNFLKGVRNNIVYEFDIVKDGKKIYNGLKSLIDLSVETVAVYRGTNEKYDPPVAGTVYRRYDSILLIDGEKVRNSGTDIKVINEGEPKSIINGIVSKVYQNDNKGYYIKIKNEEIEVTYGYLSTSYVKEGDNIKVGQVIGKTGTSKDGNNYLRIELSVRGNKVDPEDYINFPKGI
ncbi:MAG: M23 family metallopeptidase [Tissierellia bacterium]|nr:M23 family metallopeptidase [Tissierellia bacterium]